MKLLCLQDEDKSTGINTGSHDDDVQTEVQKVQKGEDNTERDAPLPTQLKVKPSSGTMILHVPFNRYLMDLLFHSQMWDSEN